jgi:hypothetical protein
MTSLQHTRSHRTSRRSSHPIQRASKSRLLTRVLPPLLLREFAFPFRQMLTFPVLIKFVRSTVPFPTGLFGTITIKCEALSLPVNASSPSVHSPELLVRGPTVPITLPRSTAASLPLARAPITPSPPLSSTPASTAASLPPANAIPAIVGGVVGGGGGRSHIMCRSSRSAES